MTLRALLAAITLACLSAGHPPSSEAAPKAPVRSITFFVASDTHFGVPGIDERNRRLIDELNGLPGLPYPAAIGGRVEAPRGVLITGDLTDYSTEEQWASFERFYGLTGKDGLLKFPVKEALGNHDFMGDSPVVRPIVRRHGGLSYSFDWDDLHVACLGMYPSADRIRWLEDDLRTVPVARPVVVFFHYGVDGPWSQSWESQSEREELARVLKGRRVAAIFHGHAHQAGTYRWRGYDVFRPGSPKHSSREVMAVRIRGDEVAVAYRDFDRSVWTNTLVTSIAPVGGRVLGAGPTAPQPYVPPAAGR
ncbi:MAG: metallophosphoesterase [Vicinamibacteria bacterium]